MGRFSERRKFSAMKRDQLPTAHRIEEEEEEEWNSFCEAFDAISSFLSIVQHCT